MTSLTDTEARADGAAQHADPERLSATVPPPQVHVSVRSTAVVGPDDVTALVEVPTA